MKSYLSLIPISARVRRRQNRMTIICIVIAVFLVTAIFSVADMMLRTQSDRMTAKNGSWHVKLQGVSQADADELAGREDVLLAGMASVFNPDGELPWHINGKRVVLYGIDEAYLSLNSEGVEEGSFPQLESEILISNNAAFVLQVQVGDIVTLQTPAGDRCFTVSGLGGVDESYYEGQYFLMDAYLPRKVFADLMDQNGVENVQDACFVEFVTASRAAKAIPGLEDQYGEEAVSENLAVMGVAGQSDSEAMKNVYGMAAMLFILVLLAGILMISGSINSNVAQRTQFFGMMRCLGMSKRQVIRFVRLEALNWCRTAVPIGTLLGILMSWGICAALHFGIGGEFSTTPVFQLSLVGIGSGAAVGIVTVLLAAQSPARRAARVSPMAAVSGNGDHRTSAYRPAENRLGRIEISLGVHHAVASRKNWLLMTLSFALSIILALCFSVLLEFAGLLLPSLCPWQPDILLNGYGNAQVLPRSTAEQLRAIPGVRAVWGATGLTDIPAESSRESISRVTLCSYDSFMMESSKGMIVEGKMAMPDSCEAMTIYNRNNPLKVGDTIRIRDTELTIACAFSEGAFPDDVVVICPQVLFDRLVGAQNYNMIGVLLNDSADKETLAQIVSMATDDIIISDERESNRQNAATYLASRIVVYGFMAIIGLISLFNIVNSISMSVSSRTRQYGAMRAIGMDHRQLLHMIMAEAATYAVSGLAVGGVAGLWLSRMLYFRLITRYFGLIWRFPFGMMTVLAIAVLFSSAAAVYAPAARMRSMAITETINEL